MELQEEHGRELLRRDLPNGRLGGRNLPRVRPSRQGLGDLGAREGPGDVEVVGSDCKAEGDTDAPTRLGSTGANGVGGDCVAKPPIATGRERLDAIRGRVLARLASGHKRGREAIHGDVDHANKRVAGLRGAAGPHVARPIAGVGQGGAWAQLNPPREPVRGGQGLWAADTARSRCVVVDGRGVVGDGVPIGHGGGVDAEGFLSCYSSPRLRAERAVGDPVHPMCSEAGARSGSSAYSRVGSGCIDHTSHHRFCDELRRQADGQLFREHRGAHGRRNSWGGGSWCSSDPPEARPPSQTELERGEVAVLAGGGMPTYPSGLSAGTTDLALHEHPRHAFVNEDIVDCASIAGGPNGAVVATADGNGDRRGHDRLGAHDGRGPRGRSRGQQRRERHRGREDDGTEEEVQKRKKARAGSDVAFQACVESGGAEEIHVTVGSDDAAGRDGHRGGRERECRQRERLLRARPPPTRTPSSRTSRTRSCRRPSAR